MKESVKEFIERLNICTKNKDGEWILVNEQFIEIIRSSKDENI